MTLFPVGGMLNHYRSDLNATLSSSLNNCGCSNASYPLPVGGCPILNTATESDDTHPALKQKVAKAIDSWRKAVIDILDEGIAAKEFSHNTNTHQVAFTILR